METPQFKNSLVSLIFEQYKQYCLSDDLHKLGIDIDQIIVDNISIVFDLIGFPRDNTKGYDHGDGDGKPIDRDYFCRDYLIDPFCEIVEIEKNQKIEVTDNGLRMTEKVNEQKVIQKITDYIVWLYEEYYKYKNSL